MSVHIHAHALLQCVNCQCRLFASHGQGSQHGGIANDHIGCCTNLRLFMAGSLLMSSNCIHCSRSRTIPRFLGTAFPALPTMPKCPMVRMVSRRHHSVGRDPLVLSIRISVVAPLARRMLCLVACPPKAILLERHVTGQCCCNMPSVKPHRVCVFTSHKRRFQASRTRYWGLTHHTYMCDGLMFQPC